MEKRPPSAVASSCQVDRPGGSKGGGGSGGGATIGGGAPPSDHIAFGSNDWAAVGAGPRQRVGRTRAMADRRAGCVMNDLVRTYNAWAQFARLHEITAQPGERDEVHGPRR